MGQSFLIYAAAKLRTDTTQINTDKEKVSCFFNFKFPTSGAETSKHITRNTEPDLYEDLVWSQPQRGTISPHSCFVLLGGRKVVSSREERGQYMILCIHTCVGNRMRRLLARPSSKEYGEEGGEGGGYQCAPLQLSVLNSCNSETIQIHKIYKK